jgi:GTP-binding protein LepA
MSMQHIRNFSIIAHIDHGKSTLADRIIHLCGGLVRSRNGSAGARLDGHRARARHHHQGADRCPAVQGAQRRDLQPEPDRYARARRFLLRSVAFACRPAKARLLVVDASQGVEAQTVANCYTAIDLGVEVMPVLNKIDLPSAMPDNARQEIEDVIGIDASRCDSGLGQDRSRRRGYSGSDHRAHSRAQGRPGGAAQGLLIDSWFDNYVGVVMLVRVVDGTLRPKDKIRLMADRFDAPVRTGRRVHPESGARDALRAGEVGYIISGSRNCRRPRSAIR